MQMLPSWRDLIIEQAKVRIIDENIARIIKCLDMLTTEQIWHRIHQHTNPIGNLVLHLEGNARQWILSTFDDAPDHRVRQQEFDTNEPISGDVLKSKLNTLAIDLTHCLDRIKEQELLDVHTVQCYRESGISIIVHVIEHFSYHTGQIAYVTKWLSEKETGFYEGQSLNQTKD